MNNQVNNNDSDSKKIFTILIMVFTLMICTTGATYAYFAISATNSVATGTAATVGLNLSVNRVLPVSDAENTSAITTWNESTKVMVPQLDAYLSNAMTQSQIGEQVRINKCVDGNGNVVCQVYKITVENTSTSAVNLRGAIYFTLGSDAVFTNLYWRQVTDANTLGTNTIYKYATDINTNSTTAEASNATLVSDLNLSPNNNVTGSGSDYIEYYVLIWIRETTLEQNDTDKGTWVMNVNFKDSAGNGVTSTITS
mgnify:CR=1 FL=1